jgi:hypothetical protein
VATTSSCVIAATQDLEWANRLATEALGGHLLPTELRSHFLPNYDCMDFGAETMFGSSGEFVGK